MAGMIGRKRKGNAAAELVVSIVTFILLLLFCGVWWVVASAIEANSYTKLTGKEVSTWDAMFLDLRVQEEVRIKE